PLSVIARAVWLADRHRDTADQSREQHCTLQLGTGDGRRVVDGMKRAAADHEWQRTTLGTLETRAHLPQRLGHPAHRARPERCVAGEPRGKTLTRQKSESE